jgi:hypothetical protein
MKKHRICKIALFVVIYSLSNIASVAQITNTDTLEKGVTYVEANLWSSTQRHQNGGQQVYGGRFSYGLKNGLEIGVNGSGSNPLDTDFPIEIQPNIKWKFYRSKDESVEVAAGAIAFVPVAKRTGTDTFLMTYANVSKKVKYGTRLTAGAYALVGRDKDFGTKQGVNLMVEKSLNSKSTLSFQWLSGKNRFGYLTGGLSYQVGKKSSVFLGYSVGNYDYDNHGPYISISRIF